MPEKFNEKHSNIDSNQELLKNKFENSEHEQIIIHEIDAIQQNMSRSELGDEEKIKILEAINKELVDLLSQKELNNFIPELKKRLESFKEAYNFKTIQNTIPEIKSNKTNSPPQTCKNVKNTSLSQKRGMIGYVETVMRGLSQIFSTNFLKNKKYDSDGDYSSDEIEKFDSSISNSDRKKINYDKKMTAENLIAENKDQFFNPELKSDPNYDVYEENRKLGNKMCARYISDVLGIYPPVYSATALFLSLYKKKPQENKSDNLIKNQNELQKGDVIFFTDTYDSGRPITHVGIIVDAGSPIMMKHHGTFKNGVKTVALDKYWTKHFYGALRPNYAKKEQNVLAA